MPPQESPLLDEPQTGVKEVALVSAAPASLDLFERLARDPNVSVEKIERIVALFERAEARKAEVAFNAAMSEAQKEIKPVLANDYNPQTNSKFASYDALDAEARPIYTKHGFGLSFDTGQSNEAGHIVVFCYVSHCGGHSRTYHVDMPADGKGAKGGDVMTKTHATGSALTYGQRYLLKLIFNIPIKDDDGNEAGGRVTRSKRQEPETAKPPKFEEQMTDLTAAADEGTDAFNTAWAAMPGAFKNYVIQHRKDQRNTLAARAAAVTKAGKP